MSEPCGMSITIGGVLPANKIKPLLDLIINGDLYEVSGPETASGLIKEIDATKDPVTWWGTSNYGECDDLKTFCEKNNLSYTHTCNACNDGGPAISFWVPTMKEPINRCLDYEGEIVAPAPFLRPIFTFLLEYAKSGKDALPLFVGQPDYADWVETGYKNPKKLLSMIEKEINDLIPKVPDIPPLTIRIPKNAKKKLSLRQGQY